MACVPYFQWAFFLVMRMQGMRMQGDDVSLVIAGQSAPGSNSGETR
jgi:hypothetical protein